MERSVRSSFHILKTAKQPSRSLQHNNEQPREYQENKTRRTYSCGSSAGQRRHITVGSPLRLENAHSPNRPEIAAPANDPQPVARPLPIMQRTIRNDKVKPPPPS